MDIKAQVAEANTKIKMKGEHNAEKLFKLVERKYAYLTYLL